MNKNFLKGILSISLCCIIPILLIASLPIIGISSPNVALTLSFIAPFICPIIMVVALLFLKKSCCDKSTNSN